MAAVVRPAFILFYSFFLSFLAKMASNWGCALSSNAPYSRILYNILYILKKKFIPNARVILDEYLGLFIRALTIQFSYLEACHKNGKSSLLLYL